MPARKCTLPLRPAMHAGKWFAKSLGKHGEAGKRGAETNIRLCKSNPKYKTPAILLTAAEKCQPSMDKATRDVLDLQANVRRRLYFYPRRPGSSQSKHKGECTCRKCRRARLMDRRFKMAMEAYDDKGNHSDTTQDGNNGEEDGWGSVDKSDKSGEWVLMEEEMDPSSPAGVFCEELPNIPEDGVQCCMEEDDFCGKHVEVAT